jgi:CheY-like chemotaxis protein
MDTKPVLYVEDDEADVFLMERAWQKVGLLPHPLYIVRDGQEAADYLRGTGRFAERAVYPMPALMLLDLKLPRMSGLDLLKWIRQQDGIRALPVVVFSSSNLVEDIEHAKALGVSDYWVKPADPRKLTEMVASLNCVLASIRPVSALVTHST